MRNFIAIFFSMILMTSFGQTGGKAIELNLGFENLVAGKELPDGWVNWGFNYYLEIDTTEKHAGKISVQIKPSGKNPTEGFGCIARSISAVFEGKEIEVKAYMKFENVTDGFVGLLLRIDGETGVLKFDNMQEQNIQGTADWRLYSIKLPYPEGARTISFGAVRTGKGKLWVDDFQVLLDGKDIRQAKKRVLPPRSPVSSYLNLQNPYIHHYTSFDGLPCNMIYDVFQDSQKFIWFATDAGAVRYDGSSFVNLTTKEGLSTDKITRIKEDSSGRVWMFNRDGSLNYYFQNKLYNPSNAPFLDSLQPNVAFYDFFEDDDHTLYFYNIVYEIFSLDTQNIVHVYDAYDDLTTSLQKSDLLPLYRIQKDSSGEYQFWNAREIIKFKDLFTDPVIIPNGQGLRSRAFCNRNGYFYIIANGNKVCKYQDEHFVDSVQLPFHVEYLVSQANTLLIDNSGLIWVGTFDQGVFCLSGSQVVQHFDIPQANAILEDHENNIWITSAKDGVYKISPYLHTHQHFEVNFFQNKGIKEMAQEVTGGLWLTNGETVYLYKNGQLSTLSFNRKNLSFDVLYQFRTGNLVIGEKYSRMIVLRYVKPAVLDSKSKIGYGKAEWSRSYISGIAINQQEDKFSTFNYFDFSLIDPDTLFGPYKNALNRMLEYYNVGSRINYLYYDLHDNLIINAKKNYILENDTFLQYEPLTSMNNRIITQHLNLNDSTELFNIGNEHIYLFRNNKFFDLSSPVGPSSDLKIRHISYDEPILYLANLRNIYTCDNPLEVLENKPANIRLLDISFRNIHKILAFQDSLYIASDDGLTIIPEASIKDIITHNPTPYIQSILVNDKETDFSGKSLTLKGRCNLKFTFSSIDYSSTPVIYSYKLEGTDPNWSSGTGNIVAYQNLPFGEYVFKLRISKPNAAWSKPLNINITIRPWFWQHPVFIIFVITLIVGSISLVIFRIARNKIKQRETDHQLILLEQKALQSMMNPHFIFNTLGSIQNYLLQNKSEEAGLYLSQFARLIRLNISSINSNMIDLEEEVKRLRIYLDLEQFRMENKFAYEIEFEEAVEEDDVYIPSMIIQPFVENSIWHGISALEGKGMIRISFAMHSPNALKVIVEDDGIGIVKSEQNIAKRSSHLHLSMEMIRKRLAIIGKKMGVETRMEISEASPGNPIPGTRVVLIIPFYRNEDR